MKYSSTNKPLVCMQTHSTCYQGTRKMEIQGVLWHSTGANNPSLKRYVQPSDSRPAEDTYDKAKWLEILGKNYYSNDWNHVYVEAGLNCWIGKLADGTVTTVQTMPWNYRPWGCGIGSKGSCNTGWIQFEICEDDLTDPVYFDKVYKEACEITAYLCKMFNIDPNGYAYNNGVKVPTIICHHDSYNYGLGSNHSDIYHWFSKFGKDMNTVRKDVSKLLGSVTTEQPSEQFKSGDLVSIKNGAVYYDGSKSVPGWVIKSNWYLKEVSGDRAVLGESEDKKNNINSPISTIYLSKVTSSASTVPSEPKGTKYDVVVNLPRYATSADAVAMKNPCGVYAPGTYYIYNKYPDGYNGVYNISTDSTGQSAGSWINPEQNKAVESEPVKKLYRVRLSAHDAKTQKGAYSSLDNAIQCCNQYASEGYKVYDWNFTLVYEPKLEEPKPEEPENPVVPTEPEQPSDPENPKSIWPTATNIIVDTDNDYTELVKCYKAILNNNPNMDKHVVQLFFDLSPKYHMDSVHVIAQSILETGWFKFEGSSVSITQNNFCGLGATGGGAAGASFDTPELGITAQLQHLFAYASTEELPEGEELVDPRFKYVTRGIAPTWEELAGKWACPGYDAPYTSLEEAAKADKPATYGQKINNIVDSLLAVEVTDEEIDEFFNASQDPDAPKNPEHPEHPEQPTEPENPEQPTEPGDEVKKKTIIDILYDLLMLIGKFFAGIFKKK